VRFSRYGALRQHHEKQRTDLRRNYDYMRDGLLEGYSQQLWNGTLETIQLALLSLWLAFVVGLIGAAAKLSHSRCFMAPAAVYTTLIRGVPDLVLMLLLFYSFQDFLNQITDALNQQQFNIDPFAAGICVLGFIYGAYFTETFRGAVLAVPSGQLEAGAAYGLTNLQIFRRILFPQMMRFALPGISNNWQVILKATALVSIIGLHDVVRAAQDAITGTSSKGAYHAFFFLTVTGIIYLLLTSLSNLVFVALERRYSLGVRQSEL
jgi:histidine transport system permease protein